MEKKSTGIKEQAVSAALALAEEKGWSHTGLAAIAEKVQIPLPVLRDHFDDKTDILAAYGRIIDKKTMEAAGAPDSSLAPRDRLFDLLMGRFDVLNENRAAVVSILKSFCFDPKQAIIGLPHLARSMAWMLEAAGFETGGIRGAVKVAGLTGLYLKTAKIWLEDDSADMARTMAALDKYLARAGQWAQSFNL